MGEFKIECHWVVDRGLRRTYVVRTPGVCAGPFENEIDAWEWVIGMLQKEVIGVLEGFGG